MGARAAFGPSRFVSGPLALFCRFRLTLFRIAFSLLLSTVADTTEAGLTKADEQKDTMNATQARGFARTLRDFGVNAKAFSATEGWGIRIRNAKTTIVARTLDEAVSLVTRKNPS